MSKKAVGVDIGSTAVRVVAVSGLDDASVALVVKAASEPLFPGAVVGGRIKDEAQVAYALATALKSAGTSGYGIVVGLSSPEGVVSRVAMPAALSRKEWVPVLRTSERDISPLLKISESALSVYPVTDIAAPEGKTMTMVGAVPRVDVETIVRVCRMAKSAPRAVDLTAAAMMRCMTRTYMGNQDVATIVDVGATKITVATRQGAHLRSVRTVAAGADDITRSVMGELDCQYDQAELYKRASRVGMSGLSGSYMPGEDSAPVIAEYGSVETGVPRVQKTAETIVGSAVSSAASALAEEIAACVEADSSKFPQNTTKGVVLCGGGALLNGMKELVADRVGVAVMLGRPWASLVPGRDTESVLAGSSDEETVMMALAPAIGLALWKGDM